MAPCPHQVKLDATFRVIRKFCDLRQLLFVVPAVSLIFMDSRLCFHPRYTVSRTKTRSTLPSLLSVTTSALLVKSSLAERKTVAEP